MSLAQPGKFLILTAVTSNFWDDYLLFYNSLRRITNIDLVVACLEPELTPEQEHEIGCQINVNTFRFNADDFELFQKMGNHWRQWFKPFYMKKCIELHNPRYLLWIDVDTVILESLDDIISEITQQFLVVRDYFAPATTLNDEKLYEKYDCPVDDPEKSIISLNSGVVGFDITRDMYILDMWVEKIKILLEDEEGRSWVQLFDQGALLWVMRELDMLCNIEHAAVGSHPWNYPAVRNAYEHTKSFKWPGQADAIGTDIINSIKFDNPGAVIAHYAGLPKLSALCQVNHEHAVRPRESIKRIFCVGLERCGTHSFAEILRRSCRVESWIRHEFQPSLSLEAFHKFHGLDFHKYSLDRRLELYNREDVKLVCEANHRLSFFIEEIYNATEQEAKFIVLLRNPLDLVKSRLSNFTICSGLPGTIAPSFDITSLPMSYQFDFINLDKSFGDGSEDQNQWRIGPSNHDGLDIIDFHLWEITNTISFIARQLKRLPEESYKVLWLENIGQWYKPITEAIGRDYIDATEVQNYKHVKFGQRIPIRHESTVWIENLVEEHEDKISTRFLDCLKDNGLNVGDFLI